MQDVPRKEDHVTRVCNRRDLTPRILRRDPREGIDLLIGVAYVRHHRKVAEVGVVLPDAVVSWVDRFMLRSDREPHAPVRLIRAVDCNPRPTQRVRIGRDVVTVLVVALTRASGCLDEVHRLQGKQVRADQRLKDIKHPRMQQVTLLDLEVPVQHVDAQVTALDLRKGHVRRWRFNPRHRHPAVHQVCPVFAKFGNLGLVQQSTNHQEALFMEPHVLLDGDHVSRARRRKVRGDHVRPDRLTPRAVPRWSIGNRQDAEGAVRTHFSVGNRRIGFP